MPTKQAPTLQKPKGAWLEFDLIIAIDPGKKTGLARYYKTPHPENRLDVRELPIWEVFEALKKAKDINDRFFVILEDARKTRRPKGVSLEESEAKKMGAGWIRTLSSLYEDFLRAHKIPYRTQKKGITKLDAVKFQLITGVVTKHGDHNARDAGMMAWQHPFRVYVESNGY